jgi:integrating conjugative element protein (TIGR03765 family)
MVKALMLVALVGVQWPIHSAQLRLGQPYELPMRHLAAPFFVIGMDAVSLHWLAQNIDRLQGAVGIVVESTDAAQFDQLKREVAALGVTLEAMPGDSLVKLYGITHYPVLLKPL